MPLLPVALLLLCAALSGTTPSSASDPLAPRVQDPPQAVPEYVIERAAGPVVIDGDPGDAPWSTAAPIPFVFPWTDLKKESAQSTVARMLYDDDRLYIVYECVDPYLDSEVTAHDGPVYEEDAVEVFATPNPADVSAYFGYEMNINGALLDYIAAKGGPQRTGQILFEWQSEGVQIETTHDGTLNDHSDSDRGWVLEIAIPFDNFRHLGGSLPPPPGAEWRLNLNRTAGDRGQFSQWSDTRADQPSFHHSAWFGRVWFAHRPTD